MRQHFTSKGILLFGKYKDQSYESIVRKDPNWLRWCCENVDGFRASMQALAIPEIKNRRTSQQVAEEAAFKKLTLNDRLQQITARARKDGNSLIEQAEREIQKNEAEDEFPEFDEQWEPPY